MLHPHTINRVQSGLSPLRHRFASCARALLRGTVFTTLAPFAALMISTAALAQAETAHDIFERNFQQLVAAQPRYAVGAAFAIGDEAPHVVVSGNQHKNSTVHVDANAAWHIGSVTKSFTAALIMRLVAQDYLDLDAPIGGYLGAYQAEMHPDWQALTLRQLLSHTGGVPRDGSLWGFLFPPQGSPSETRVIEMQRHWNRPLKTTGQDYAYSNLGYVLAAIVVEEVMQEAWFNLVKREISEPLGLDSLGFGPPTDATDPWGHKSFLGSFSPVHPASDDADSPAWMGPAGQLRISMSDLVKWGQIHLEACQGQRPDFLSRESCTTLLTPVSADYGLGWIILPVTGHDATLVWHNGSNTKWYSLLAIIPEHDVVFAVSLNRFEESAIDAFARAMIIDLMAVL